MRIVVMGAGAVGNYYGARLAEAGHEVTLIGRAPHVAALRQRGLILHTAGDTRRIAVQAAEDVAAAATAELLLCCVKSGDTTAAAKQLLGVLPPSVPVLSLQNGVDNGQCLREILPNPVLDVVVYVATEMVGPGELRHHGRGDLVLPDEPLAQRLAEVLRGAGIAVELTPDIRVAQWSKLVVNCTFNALSAISGLPYGGFWPQPDARALMRAAYDETMAVARADGVHLPGDLWSGIERIATTMPGQHSSTAQDLARGRRTEIEHLNGLICRRGAALGVATPINQTLYRLVRLKEDAGAAPG